MADVGTLAKCNSLANDALTDPGADLPGDPSATASTLDALFAAHFAGVCLRTARALEACGYSALLVHSGSLLPVFQDDRTHPFEVHAPFKVWAPLLDVPDCFL